MLGRILILLRTLLAAQRGDAKLPFAALLVQAAIASAICGLVRGDLPPFAYAMVALSTSAALIAVPLLGELSRLLVADESGDWIRAMPVRPIELHLARTAHLVIALTILSLGSLVPAAALASKGFDAALRVELLFCGLGQSLAIAAALLAVQAILRGHAQALLVVVQSALFVAILVGATVGLRKVPSMVAWNGPEASNSLAAYPPAWFAAPLASESGPGAWPYLALAVSLAAALVLLALPAPPARTAVAGQPLAGRLLAPLRALATRTWVRPDERASFEWLFDALPKERDFVLRTYPLLAVPVAFLWFSARAESAASHSRWLAMLLFVPGAYLPLLAAHVPGSTSHFARWIVDTAPVERSALDAGALKAVAVRFLVPFFALLGVLGCLLGDASVVARLLVPAWIASVLVLRATWRLCVTSPPLSVSPDELYVNQDWLGTLAVLAGVLTLAAFLASKYVVGPVHALALVAVLAAAEFVADRRQRTLAA